MSGCCNWTPAFAGVAKGVGGGEMRAEPAVIPTQAGIQVVFWTPASAGVTKGGGMTKGAGVTKGARWYPGAGREELQP